VDTSVDSALAIDNIVQEPYVYSTPGTLATVDEAPLSNVVNVPFTATEDVPFSGTVASFTDTDPGSAGDPTTDPGEYSATISWGDGSNSPGTIAYAGTPGQFLVNGSHTYAEEGSESGFQVVVSHGVTVNNPDFASALSGWTVKANGNASSVSVLGPVAPSSGGTFAVLKTNSATTDTSAFSNTNPGGTTTGTEGTILTQSFTAKAGDTISVDYNFLSNKPSTPSTTSAVANS
jgi:hypothetical protein